MAGNITSRAEKQRTTDGLASEQLALSTLCNPGSPTHEMDPSTLRLGFLTINEARGMCRGPSPG